MCDVKTRLVGAVAALMLAVGPAWATQPNEAKEGAMNATLWGSTGKEVALSRWRGKPVILFYEDRHSTTVNQAFKQALFTQGQSQGLLDAVWVVPVANLESFNFFPAREIALSYVRDEEKKWNVPILVDLEGVLARAPWNLPKKSSSVVLLDAEGRQLYSHSGVMEKEDMEAFFRTLTPLLGQHAAPVEAHP